MEIEKIPIMKDEKSRILYVRAYKDTSKILVVNTYSKSKLAQNLLINSVFVTDDSKNVKFIKYTTEKNERKII